jgi:hypothetical protein
MAKQAMQSSSKLSCSSKLSNSSRVSSVNFNTNHNENIEEHRNALRNGENLLTLDPTEALKDFLKLQNQLDKLDEEGVFDALKSIEIELQIVQKNRNEAESIYKTLYEQSKRERMEGFEFTTVENYYLDHFDYDRPFTTEIVTHL